MLRNSICETNGKFRQRKLLNVEGTNTSRTGRIENSQTKHKSLERVIFCFNKNIVKNSMLNSKNKKQVWFLRLIEYETQKLMT